MGESGVSTLWDRRERREEDYKGGKERRKGQGTHHFIFLCCVVLCCVVLCCGVLPLHFFQAAGWANVTLRSAVAFSGAAAHPSCFFLPAFLLSPASSVYHVFLIVTGGLVDLWAQIGVSCLVSCIYTNTIFLL